MKVTELPGGERVAEECECRQEARAGLLLRRANIPKRYDHCSLKKFLAAPDSPLQAAKIVATNFVREYPATGGKGIMLVGDIGVGKTHLAVAMLRYLIESKGARGLFCDYRELLKDVQNSYNPQVLTTELSLLQPVFDAEVLVLDELGAAQPTDWVGDTVSLILNTRYNKQRTTIVTTNFVEGPAAEVDGRVTKEFRAERTQTLGDRIGNRMRSRLAEMCVMVEMRGDDFRLNEGRARFG